MAAAQPEKMFLQFPEDEVIEVSAGPRQMPRRAWLRVASRAAIALVALAVGVFAVGAAYVSRADAGRMAIAGVLALAFFFGAWAMLQEAIALPRLFREGIVLPVELVMTGEGEPFSLRIGTEDPRDDEEPVKLDNSFLAVGFQAEATIEIDGRRYASNHSLDGGDVLRPVRIGNYVGAAAFADPTNPARALLITRNVVPRA